MIRFDQYLAESKNLHLEHLEDAVFNEGSAGVEEAVRFINAVADMIRGNTSKKYSVTTKWDGAPSVFCGINPENGKFFVGSKSVFNKTPKINYTPADVKRNHVGGVVDKLIACFALKNIGIRGVLQGDLLFTPGDKTNKKINGVQHITFKPNTITYAVPTDSELGSRIAKANIGIVFHTSYEGKTLPSMRAKFGASVKGLRRTNKVWFDDATVKDFSGTGTLTTREASVIDKQIKKIESLSNSSKDFLDMIYKHKIVDDIKIYVNSLVRTGNFKPTAADFINFFKEREEANIDKLKTEKAQNRKRAELKDKLREVMSMRAGLNNAFRLQKLLSQVKTLFTRKLSRIDNMPSFIQTDNGFEATSPEGFVVIDHITDKAYKLVDRMEFSRLNFTTAKDWIRGN